MTSSSDVVPGGDITNPPADTMVRSEERAKTLAAAERFVVPRGTTQQMLVRTRTRVQKPGGKNKTFQSSSAPWRFFHFSKVKK